jgi:hypothetical protein
MPSRTRIFSVVITKAYHWTWPSVHPTPKLNENKKFLEELPKSKSKLLYDWRFVANQFVLASSPLRPTTRDSFFELNPSGNSPYVTSSLTRRWVSLLWICLAFCQVYIPHIEHIIENVSFCTTQKFVSTGFSKQIMPILRILCYNGSLVTWTVVSLTTSKFKFLIFSVSGFAFGRTTVPLSLEYMIRHGPYREHHAQQFFYCCVCISCRNNAFTKPLPNNVRIFYYSDFQALGGDIQTADSDLISLLLFFKIRKIS